EAISDKCKHGSNRDADLRTGGGWIDPENRPRHHHDENEGQNHFENVVLHVAESGELEDVTRILHARCKSVRACLDIPFLNGPIRQGDRWRDSAGLLKTGLHPLLIRHELNLVRAVSDGYEMHVESLFVERERF